jgi:hypoxanthine phosphoribosyltransferase
LNALKKKLYDKNPNVQLFALHVLESWVKNCGVLIHDELLASKDSMEELHEIVRQSPNEKVRKKVLELIQIWGNAFKGQTKYQAVQV